VDPIRYDPVIVALDYRNLPEFTDLWDPASETHDVLMSGSGKGTLPISTVSMMSVVLLWSD
jgi:hypothetical protein